MKIETKQVNPRNENVLVSIIFQEEKDKDGMHVGGDKQATQMRAEFYRGLVENLGDNSTTDEQCPGLKVGEYVIFSQFAGSAIPTEDKYCKLIKGYDIVAVSKNEDMKLEEIKPTADRLLIEVIEEGIKDEDGMYTGASADPRERQTQKGIIKAIGPTVKDSYKVGDLVYFDPFCGNLIVDNDEAMLKTVNTFDILFTV